MANDRDTSEEFKAGLKHVVAHSQSTPEDTRKCVDNVMNGTGSPSGSLGSLLSNAKASMLVSWFRDGSIQEFKNWAYVAARLEHIRNQMDKMDFRAYDLLAAILSDNEVMIKWYATEGFFWPDESVHRLEAIDPDQQELLDSWVPASPRFNRQNADDHKSFHFFSQQAILALRGDWGQLESRCLRLLADPPEYDQIYLIDYQFYLALARGDQAGMEAALTAMTSPEVAAIRNYEDGSGLTQRLISTFGVIYAKIAWRHAYPLKINTPFIPADWLPVRPLQVYVEPYEFMPRYPMA